MENEENVPPRSLPADLKRKEELLVVKHESSFEIRKKVKLGREKLLSLKRDFPTVSISETLKEIDSKVSVWENELEELFQDYVNSVRTHIFN